MTYQKMIQSDSYFKVVRITPNYIEFQSINTDQCWIIQKVNFQNGWRYRLYHKHSCETEYYHLHKDNCYNMKNIIKSIKSHDDWYLNQS